MSVTEGQLLWSPSQETVDQANVTHFMHWLRDQGTVECSDYQQLWRWSVKNTEAFWGALWQYIDVISYSPYDRVASGLEMKPGIRWFEGSRVNWAEHILRHWVGGKTALYALSESRALFEVSWTDLAAQVRILATRMRRMGVKPGDAV
jgi:acetoacetyl-CoA synthetase